MSADDIRMALSYAAKAMPSGQRRAFRAFLADLPPLQKGTKRRVHSWRRKSKKRGGATQQPRQGRLL
jgi:hypothetical protein